MLVTRRATVRRRKIPRVAVALVAAIALAFGASPALGADGDLDTSFGDDGQLTTDFPIGSFATAVAVQADGKIVAVGAAAGASIDGEFAIARYEPDGDLDETFGDGGTVVTPIAGGNGDEARSVAIQENGRIVVAGTDSWRKWALVRSRGDGMLDDSFGDGGIVRTNFTPGDDVAGTWRSSPMARSWRSVPPGSVSKASSWPGIAATVASTDRSATVASW
jgi:uncharacterized delta-60 repeat protein